MNHYVIAAIVGIFALIFLLGDKKEINKEFTFSMGQLIVTVVSWFIVVGILLSILLAIATLIEWLLLMLI